MGMTMRIDGEIFSDEVNSVNFGVRQVKQSSTGGVVKEMVGVSTSTFSTKTATVVLIVHGTHRDAIRTRCDEIVKAAGLGTSSTFYNAIHLFSFSALSHSFRGVLKKYQMQELVPDRMTRLTLTLEGQEVGPRVVVRCLDAGNYGWEYLKRLTLDNPGTYWTPMMVDMRISYQAAHDGIVRSGLFRSPWFMKVAEMKLKCPSNTSFDALIDGETGRIKLLDPEERFRVVYDSTTTQSDPTFNNPRLYERAHRSEISAQERDMQYPAPTPYDPQNVSLEFPGLPFLAPGRTTFTNASDAIRIFQIAYYPVYL